MGYTGQPIGKKPYDVYDKTDTYTKVEIDSSKIDKSANLSDVASVPTARTNLDVYSKSEVDSKDAIKLNSSAYTASDVLAKVKAVDGAGSGLDADLLDGAEGTSYLNIINRLPDSGRFDGSNGSAGIASGTATNSIWFSPYSDITVSYADKVICDTSTYGGSAAALTAEAQGFVEFIGRAYRYQLEYYIAKFVKGTAATLVNDTTGGVNRYLMTTNYSSHLNSTLVNKLSFWVKVNAGSFVCAIDDRGRTVITPTDGWQYITTTNLSAHAYENAFPHLTCEHSSEVLIALPCLYVGNVTMPKHNNPIATI